MKNCARAPTVLSRTVGAQAETRVWRGTAGHRRASSQEPCDDLDARREPAFHAVVLAPAKLPSHVAFPAPVIPFVSVHRHHSLMNLASHQGIVPLLSERSRNAKTSLGIAPNCFRSAPETPKPRWHRSKLISERSRSTKTSRGIALQHRLHCALNKRKLRRA